MRKNLKISVLALMSAIAFTSCVREEFDQNGGMADGKAVKVTVNTGETDVKSYMEYEDGKYVPKWHKGDVLGGYFVGGASPVQAELINNNENDRKASFKGNVELTAGKYTLYAVCPARAVKSLPTGTSLVAGLEFPYIQFPTATSFDPKADVLVSVPHEVEVVAEQTEVTVDDMCFRRLGSIVKIVISDKTGKLAGDNIKSVYLESDMPGAALSGVFNYDYDIEDAASTGMTQTKNHVTADLTRLESPLALDGNNAVYVMLPPCTLTAGSKLTVNVKTDKHEVVKTVNLAKDLSFPSSQLVALNVALDETCSFERVYFQDNFDWLYYWWDSIPASDKDGIRDPISAGTTSAQKQPNIWSKYASTVGTDVSERGYTDLNKSGKVLYVQENYFKMGKTNVHTGLELPAIEFGTEPVDVELSLDLAFQDVATEIVVEVLNVGRCADTETATSRRLFNEKDLTWKTETVVLKGVTNETRIRIKPCLSTLTATGQYRWFLDNIRISDVVPASDDRTVFPIVWSFRAPSDSWVQDVDFGVVAETGGSYLYSDTHSGKVSLIVPDDETNTSDNKYVSSTNLANESRYELCQYGVYKDSYWLFEVYDVMNPAGTYNIQYRTCSSASGPKYFLMEYSLDGGANWIAINSETNEFYYNDDPNDAHGPMNITYTYWVHSGSQLETINQQFRLDEIPTKTTMLIRSKVAEDYRASKNGSIASNGSHRLGGNIIISFTPDAE